MTIEIDRPTALAYRMQALSLTGPRPKDPGPTDLLGLGVLDLGVQDTPPGSARLSIATRLGAELDPFDDDGVAMAWTTRGSPHLHRSDDLPGFADALWPLSDKDATARLGGGGKALAATGMSPLDGFAAAVEGMAEVVTTPMTKPEASAAVDRAPARRAVRVLRALRIGPRLRDAVPVAPRCPPASASSPGSAR